MGTITRSFANLITASGPSAVADGSITVADLVSGVTGANTPAFYVHQSSNQTINNTTHTKIQFQTETLDSDNCFDSATNYRFTPTTAGYYLLTVGLRCDSGNAEYFLQIYKNGSGFVNLRDDVFTNYQLNGSALVYANGTDYFEVYFWQNSGTSKTTSASIGSTYFSGFRIIGV